MSNSPAVLVCPLDWGIGHATRCVPVIRKFMEIGYRVILAADGRALDFLKIEFPGCKTIHFPGVKINYTANRTFAWKMVFLAPVLLYGIFKEHFQLKKLILSQRPSVVFSDNRYGLWSKDVKSIFMTHQLMVIPPGGFRIFSGLINSILHFFIRKFDECWIPDNEIQQGLAGLLSHPLKISFPVHYVGTISRFSVDKNSSISVSEKIFDFMVILSGPEPQRTVFERIIFQKVKGSGLSGLIVRGRTEESEERDLTENIRVFSHLETKRMQEFIRISKIVICRPGYSSLMDLVTLGKNAVLVPTPGQTEQEYLARYLMEKKIFFSMAQWNFDLLYALEMSRNFSGMVMSNDYQLLDERIKSLFSSDLSEKNHHLGTE